MAPANKLDGLLPQVRALMVSLMAKADAAGFPIRCTQGLRTWEEQDELWAQGRTTPGRIVTNAKGGQSAHNYGRAADFCFIGRDGNLSWDGPWEKLGELGESLGLEWGGRWARFADRPHFQLLEGRTLSELRAEAQDHTAET